VTEAGISLSAGTASKEKRSAVAGTEL